MRKKKTEKGLLLYIMLTGVFTSCLITSNLIFLKFFTVKISLFNTTSITFTQSVGLIAYPITFLITDIVSEIYGQKKANYLVLSGVISSGIVMMLIFLADSLPAANFSNPENLKVDNDTFHLVFGQFGIAMAASLFTYLICQLIDIRIFHFWKKVTRGKHLWLRNNCSAIFSQLIDTFLILFLLMTLSPEKGLANWYDLKSLFINGFIFKILVALIDTIPLYVIVKYLRVVFKLKINEVLD